MTENVKSETFMVNDCHKILGKQNKNIWFSPKFSSQSEFNPDDGNKADHQNNYFQPNLDANFEGKVQKTVLDNVEP